MIININSSDYISESKHHTCNFHKKHPFKQYAGCTCWGSYTMRRLTQEEKWERAVEESLEQYSEVLEALAKL